VIHLVLMLQLLSKQSDVNCLLKDEIYCYAWNFTDAYEKWHFYFPLFSIICAFPVYKIYNVCHEISEDYYNL